MTQASHKGTSSSGSANQWEGSIGSPQNIDSDSPQSSSDSRIGKSDKGMISQASEKLLDTAEQQKAAGASFMTDMAGAVRRAAGEFEGQIPQAATYIRYAADQIDNMSMSVKQRNVGQLMSDLQSFARQQPTAFLGATFLAGFAAVRFIKSSSSGEGSAAAMRAPRSQDDFGGYDQGGRRSGMIDRENEWRSPLSGQ